MMPSLDSRDLGEARCTYKGGLKYTGGMLNSEFHGKGRLVFGTKWGWYEGQFKLGRQARQNIVFVMLSYQS